jgi:hypothetical protein
MTNRFVHVGFCFKGVPRILDLEPIFTSFGGDWIRYSETNWVLWSSFNAYEVFGRLMPRVNPDDQVLAVHFTPDECWGSLPPWMWMWMNSKIPGTGVVFGDELRAVIKQLPSPPPKPPL